jgi:hypothetical protein
MPSEPGKCYAKCWANSKIEYDYESFFRYKGDTDSLPEGVEKFVYQPREGEHQWVTNNDNSHTILKQSKDQLFWHPVQDDHVIVFEVIDTSVCKDYILDSIRYGTEIQGEVFTEWREVVCERDLTNRLIKDIQARLIETGALGRGESKGGEVDGAFKAALIKFQLMNGLPPGQVDMETLSLLRIKP